MTTTDYRRTGLAFLAYLVPSFVIAFAWHIQLFAGYYDALQIYRDELIVPLGFGSMLIQGAFFALAYPRLFGGLPFGAGIAAAFGAYALIAWSYTVLPVAAKFPMASVADFMAIESAFTVVQFAVCVPLMALAWRGARRGAIQPAK